VNGRQYSIEVPQTLLNCIKFGIPAWRTRKVQVVGALVLAGSLGALVWFVRRDRRLSRLTPLPAGSEQGIESDTCRARRPRLLPDWHSPRSP
jgi:hypothetical protein